VFAANMALAYFMFNEWKFYNEKLIAILDNFSADKEFGFPFRTIDGVDYFK